MCPVRKTTRPGCGNCPHHARFTSRVCVVCTWNPEGTIRPGAIERIDVAGLDATGILMLAEETLWAVNFPIPLGGALRCGG